MRERHFSAFADDISDALAQFADRLDCPTPLSDVCRYVVTSPGKRVRGTLCLLTAEAAGTRADRAMQAAVAVEAVHAASLILDDLPAMDDAPTRRGQPSAHVAFDEAHAILAAIALLNGAYAHLSPHSEDTQDNWPGLAVHLLARGVGGHGLVGGQTRDIAAAAPAQRPPSLVGRTREYPDHEAALATVRATHAAKTGALFAAALALGGAPHGSVARTQVDALWTAGMDIGLAFQGYDDLLDRYATAAAIGKPTGLDARKTTIATLMPRDDAERWCQDHVTGALRRIDDLFGAETRLATYIREMGAMLRAPLEPVQSHAQA